MAFVLDISVTAAWGLCIEISSYAERLAMKLIEDGAVVPPIWRYEVSSLLAVLERRGLIRPDDADRFLAILQNYPIEVDPLIDQESSLSLAERHQISFYDAAYLELARRRKLPLATLDNWLRKAARAEGVPLAR